MHQFIGRFEIRRELGRGDQSVIYLAWDPQLQREVTIKTMHFDHADAQLNQKLLTEARAVSNLRHANVVPIFDAGEHDGDPYLVFEFVDGHTLADVLPKGGPIESARAADLMRQVVDGLAQAHMQGIIHGDLKPSNIILDAERVPRIMNFGIVSQLTNSQGGDQQGLVDTLNPMPGHVENRVITAQDDIYAIGLILLEMVAGQSVRQGGSAEQVFYKSTRENVQLPSVIDERLGAIILKACDCDQALSFADAVQMRQALDQYLFAGSMGEMTRDGQKQSTLEFLLRRMRHKSDFPALSSSVSAINKLTDSDKESIHKLSNTILKDYALTNKILRLVNSTFYRQAGGNISTVSRAVVVLGFDAVRNIAITVLLFEHLQNNSNIKELKESFLYANLAGLLARNAGKKFLARESEEAFICALFHSLGKLLAQYYFPEEVETMRILMQQKKMKEDQISVQVLGISFEDLGIGVARSWGFPASIVNSMRALSDGGVRKPATHDETLWVTSGFANELCAVMAETSAEGRPRAIKQISARFAASMKFSDKQLQDVLEQSFDELTQVASILQVNLKQSSFACQVASFAGATLGGDNTPQASDATDTLALSLSGMTLASHPGLADGEGDESAAQGHQSETILTAGIQDISNSLLEDFSLSDTLRVILETMYRAMGFKRVILCLKDARMDQMVGRFGFGPDTTDMVKLFRFPLGFSSDVFHLATSKAVDILINDIDDPKIADKIPAWYRGTIPARTFILFPLNIKGKPVALIYCDKDKAGSVVISEKELQLLKTLRNQAVLAIKSTS
jgi:serine/threonine protein kinase